MAKGQAVVCLRLPPGPGKTRRTSRTWEVAAAVPDIGALAGELTAAGVGKVPLESTSDYWRTWFAVLEAAGVPVQLVNSSQAKNLPGRPKTDQKDAAWLARLTERGLLRPSFVPPRIRALRGCTRQLVHLTGDRTRHWQRPEKLPEDALCELTSVVSGLAGSKSCRAMIEAMIAGQTDPRVLAGYALRSMKAKHAALAGAFTGMRFTAQHAFAAASHPQMITMPDGQIEALETQISEHLAQIPAAWGADAGGTTGPGAGTGPGAAALPAVDRLAEIPGVSPGIAAGLIAEIGLDMTVFPTPDALVSWAGLAPVAHRPGPRAGRGKKGHGNSYARRYARQAGNGGPHRHLPGPAAPPHPQPPRPRRMEQGQHRGRPVHPHHRLAPAEGPVRPLRRPRPGPLREAHRRQPQGPRPQTPARGPRLRRRPHPRHAA